MATPEHRLLHNHFGVGRSHFNLDAIFTLVTKEKFKKVLGLQKFISIMAGQKAKISTINCDDGDDMGLISEKFLFSKLSDEFHEWHDLECRACHLVLLLLIVSYPLSEVKNTKVLFSMPLSLS